MKEKEINTRKNLEVVKCIFIFYGKFKSNWKTEINKTMKKWPEFKSDIG